MTVSELVLKITADTRELDKALERSRKMIADLAEQAGALRGVNSELDAAADAVIDSLERMELNGNP